MGWHFGYNCNNYVPTLGKCRVRMGQYAKRPDLLKDRTLGTAELLLYTSAEPDALMECIVRREITALRIKKDGRFEFVLPTAWAWDDCPLSNDGGQCLDFEPHGGRHITCLAELQREPMPHPNADAVPSLAEVTAFENGLTSRPDLWHWKADDRRH